MVALLTPALSATASMLTADRPLASRSCAAASRIALCAAWLRGRPRPVPVPGAGPDPAGEAAAATAGSRRLRVRSRRCLRGGEVGGDRGGARGGAGEHLEKGGDVLQSVTQRLGPAQRPVRR